jgi:indolin-2-one monooxygenase/3-hydroxyindolin-2-one monooxygenase/benzoxazinone N-monooxygenase
MAVLPAALQLAIGTSTPPAVLLLIVAVPLLLIAWARSSSNTAGRKLRFPPSPPGSLPIIGHLHHIGAQTHISLQNLVTNYGDNGLLFLRAGAVPTVIVGSPSAAEAVMRTHDHILSSRPWSMASHILRYNTTDVAFSPLGEYWQTTRKLVNTHLLSNKKVFSFRHGRQEEVNYVISRSIQAGKSDC